MKNLITILCIFITFGLVSCDQSNNQAKQFAEDFAAAVKNKDAASITRMYPDAAIAGSLSLNFNADSLKIEVNEMGDTIRYQFAPDISMVAVKDANDSIRIITSHGLFAYAPDKLKLAKATGQYDPSLTDKENVGRMSDQSFLEWLKTKIAESQKNVVVVSKDNVTKSNVRRISEFAGGGSTYTMTVTVVVSNKSNKEIKGDSYSVNSVMTWNWNENLTFPGEVRRGRDSASRRLSGRPIPANGTVTYTWSKNFEHTKHFWNNGFRVSSKVNYTPESTDDLSSYEPTGAEFAEYLAGKTNSK